MGSTSEKVGNAGIRSTTEGYPDWLMVRSSHDTSGRMEFGKPLLVAPGDCAAFARGWTIRGGASKTVWL